MAAVGRRACEWPDCTVELDAADMVRMPDGSWNCLPHSLELALDAMRADDDDLEQAYIDHYEAKP
jgi:hypothetical protein